MSDKALTPTARRLLRCMKAGETYSPSALGYLVFGFKTDYGKHISPQGAALSVGRFIRELREKGYAQEDFRRHPDRWYTHHAECGKEEGFKP